MIQNVGGKVPLFFDKNLNATCDITIYLSCKEVLENNITASTFIKSFKLCNKENSLILKKKCYNNSIIIFFLVLCFLDKKNQVGRAIFFSKKKSYNQYYNSSFFKISLLVTL